MIGKTITPEHPGGPRWVIPFLLVTLFSCPGCGIFSGLRERPFSITAVNLSPGGECEPQGIPYYLPKPLLIVAKNVRHIEESKVGLSGPVPIPGGFDNQSAYADVKANVTVPGGGEAGTASADTAGIAAAISGAVQGTEGSKNLVGPSMMPDGRMEDGMTPDCFYTYQIVFVPDLSQKYGLRINGGPGEVRAAMNMVNGWMYTGMGPFYLKDSSTAQNRIASGVQSMFAGRGAADVLNEVGEIAALPGALGPRKAESGNENPTVDSSDLFNAFDTVAKMVERENLVPQQMLNYAEIYVYEPELMPDGQMQWELIAEHHFDRQFMAPGVDKASSQMMPLLQQLMNTPMLREPQNGGNPGPATDLEDIQPVNPHGSMRPNTESGDEPSDGGNAGASSAAVAPNALQGNLDLLGEPMSGALRLNQAFPVLPARSTLPNQTASQATFRDTGGSPSSADTLPANTINVNLGSNVPPLVKPVRTPLFHWLKKDRPTYTSRSSRVETTQ